MGRLNDSIQPGFILYMGSDLEDQARPHTRIHPTKSSAIHGIYLTGEVLEPFYFDLTGCCGFHIGKHWSRRFLLERMDFLRT